MRGGGIFILVIFVPLIFHAIYSVISGKKKKAEEEARKNEDLVFVHETSEELSKTA